MGPISSNLLKKAFATWQHAFLSPSIAFYNIFARAYAEIKILRLFLDKKVTYVVGFFLNLFFAFPFPSFPPFLIFDPVLGLLPVKKTSKKAL